MRISVSADSREPNGVSGSAHIAGNFRDIAACGLTPEGDYLVFDRVAHSVWLVTRAGEAKEIVQIGVEPGKLLRPLAFDPAAEFEYYDPLHTLGDAGRDWWLGRDAGAAAARARRNASTAW